MPPVKVNARDQIVQVLDDDGITWLEIVNLTTITPNPGENEESVDTTTMSSKGHYEQEIMQRGKSLTLEGLQTKDLTTGAKDPGQARCEELAAEVSYASLGTIRLRHVMDTVWERWSGTFSLGEQGGDTNAKSSWSCTITRSGEPTTMAVA